MTFPHEINSAKYYPPPFLTEAETAYFSSLSGQKISEALIFLRSISSFIDADTEDSRSSMVRLKEQFIVGPDGKNLQICIENYLNNKEPVPGDLSRRVGQILYILEPKSEQF
ncbi:MAG: hypothetical protein KR126chlam3_01612 [Chlamydiae bacterium]|nr:hypothetical protein [Chlamydiota bacterium]